MTRRNFNRKASKMITYHVRKNDGSPVATLVAEKTGTNEVTVGWSLCNRKDRFNKKVGLKVAFDRIKLAGSDVSHTPRIVKRNLGQFLARSMKYFRVNNVKVAGKMD